MILGLNLEIRRRLPGSPFTSNIGANSQCSRLFDEDNSQGQASASHMHYHDEGGQVGARFSDQCGDSVPGRGWRGEAERSGLALLSEGKGSRES